MKNKLIYATISILIVITLVACSRNNGINLSERDQFSTNFLKMYYEVSHEDLENVSNYLASMENSDLSIEEQQETMEKYANSLREKYKDIVSQKEVERLMANRELDRVIQIAYQKESTFVVNNIELSVFVKKDNYVVYDYSVSVEDKSKITGKVESYDFIGKINVEQNGKEYIIFRFEPEYY